MAANDHDADVSSPVGDSNSNRSIDRRTFVSARVASGTVAFAGCSSNSGSSSDGGDSSDREGEGSGEDGSGSEEETVTTESGPAEFTEGRIDGPEEVVVDETVEFSVSVANSGGETDDFEGELTNTSGPQDVSEQISIEEVAPGDRESTTVEVTLSRADDYVFEFSGDDIDETTHELTVGPIRVESGEAVAIEENVRGVLQSVEFPWSLPVVEDRGMMGHVPTVVDAPTDQVLAVGVLEIENTGSETVEVGRFTFDPIDGAYFYGTEGPTNESIQVNGPPTFGEYGTDVEPAQSITRRVFLRFDREQARDGVEIGVQRDADETPYEIVMEANPDGGEFTFPELELTELNHPDSQSTSSPAGEISFTVENTGSVETTFYGAVQWRDGQRWTNSDLLDPDSFSATLPPGESKEFTTAFSGQGAASGTFTYRIAPFEERFEITFSE